MKTIFPLAVILLLALSFASSTPNGASVVPGISSRLASGAAPGHNATAGNVTALTVFAGDVVSQTWQGYYGNVSGGLSLGDASANVLYNWSLMTPSGEVYTSTNSSITWADIQCFNFSATGTYQDESGNGGTTNQYGTNASILEPFYGINSTDIDGINETFSEKNHDQFFSSNLEFSENECRSLQLFTGSGIQDGTFEETILYEPTSRSIIFASILENSIADFNGNQVDFQMLVPEDGHGADTEVTQYYFFIEIE